MVNGYYLLGKDWLEAKREWAESGMPTPPVMITVANRTETAARIKYAFDHGKIRIDELRAPERTLHIDSKVLEKAEAQDEPVALVTESTEEDNESEVARPLTKQQQAEQLRRMVDTVGQVGQPGEQIQNVISVGMLSEGWDAKTVTHIMGLRAFSSQLLCEQVVGRGLRRTSYEMNPETKLFEPEYVNIFGVPFTFLPHEGGGDTPPPPPKPKTRVEAIPERELEFGISWPNMVRVEHVYTPRLTLDVNNLPVLTLRASDTATSAGLAPVMAGKPDITKLAQIELEELARQFRMQKIVFETARDVFDQMKPDWPANKDFLLAQLIRLVESVLKSNRIAILPESFAEDDLRRRIMLTLNMNKIVQHLWQAIRCESTESLKPVFDEEHPILSTSQMRPWHTGRPNEHTRKSHVNVCVYDSTWEASEAYVLDRSDLVSAWVKNDHLGFEIYYIHRGVPRRYRPDYLIRLVDGTMLVLEVKGEVSEEAKAKQQFLEEWVTAVNASGEFGRWASDMADAPATIHDILRRQVQLAAT